MPGREELPSTLRRSPAKARETWVKAHDSAVGMNWPPPSRTKTTGAPQRPAAGGGSAGGDHDDGSRGGAGPGPELLVVGSRGEKTMTWLLGSQYIPRNAPCPVLVVPDTG